MNTDLKPGRGLDQLIAEKVMSHKILVNQSLYPDGLGEQCGSVYGPLGHYSTDMNAAMEVLEKLRRDYPFLTIQSDSNGIWDIFDSFDDSLKNHLAEHGSLPIAICMAALKAKGVKI